MSQILRGRDKVKMQDKEDAKTVVEEEIKIRRGIFTTTILRYRYRIDAKGKRFLFQSHSQNSPGFLPRIIKSWKSPPPSKIARPPGMVWLRFADFFFSPKVVEKTFKQIAGDWREEYFAALQQNRYWKARWINVRYNYAFCKAMGLSKIYSTMKNLVSMSIK